MNGPEAPQEDQEGAALDQGQDLSPTERRYREQRDLRVDAVLRRVHKHGVEFLSEAELSFLERASAELRHELGWDVSGPGPGWDPPREGPLAKSP